jgi:putative intracellular protease/amidase
MNRKRTLIAAAVVLAVLGGTALSLPSILRAAGLHPHHAGATYTLSGKRALIVTTSHGTLGDTGKATGVYASEMTVPYYAFLDAGMAVDVASVEGGAIPVEPMSLRWPLMTEADKRFMADPIYKAKVASSPRVADVDPASYDLVYLAGGWGASWDLGTSEALGRGVSAAWAKGAILGSVCHGALGFLKAVDTDGQPLVKGKRMTAVTDKQVRELGIGITPMHPETELRKAGALYESATAFKDILANHVVMDGDLVTGQNQNAGAEVAQAMMLLLSRKAGSK